MTMSSATMKKHARTEDADAEYEYPAPKAARANDQHPSHPFYILDHLVKNVLPEKCRNDRVKAFYQAQLDNPEDTIEECKKFLAKWVLEMWDKGTLWKHDKYLLLPILLHSLNCFLINAVLNIS